MKKFIYILVILLLVLNCSKDGDESNSNREYITTCYRFVEEGSGVPIPNLSILIHYGYSNVLSSQGITDNDGIWCFEHWNDEGSTATLYQPMIRGYWKVPETLPLNGSTNTIELIPKSWINFHIVNVEPSSINDRIDVRTRIRVVNVTPFYDYGASRPFEGKEIDTYWKTSAIKGEGNYIEWKIKESGVLISTHRDTIRIEQHRDVVEYLIEY